MVKAQSMVLEERIAYEAQRLKLKYFGEERWVCLRTLAEDRVRGSYTGKGILRLGPLHLYQLCGSGGYKRGRGGSGGGKLASDMESGKEASVLELRMVRARGNKCQPHEREKIKSSSSPNNCFTTKDLESTQRERQKIRGINQKFSEDDKRLKRAKGLGSHRSSVRGIGVGRKSPVKSVFKMGRSSVNKVSISGRKNESDSEGDGGLKQFLGFPSQLVSYPLGFDAFREFCKAKGAIREEETELKLVLGELGLSKKKGVESRSKKVVKAQSTRSMTGVNEGTRQTSGDEVAQGKRRRAEPLEGSGEKVSERQSILGDDLKEVEERARLAILQGKEDANHMESELKKLKGELVKNLVQAMTDALKEVKQLKAAHAMAIGQLQEEVDAIKDDTYAEEEEEEVKVLGVEDGLDGVSPQIVFDNQGDDVELHVDGSEKAKLDASRIHEDYALMCDRKFTEQFDRMKEVNENRQDQYVKVYFRLEKLNQVVSDLTSQVEEKDSGIKKGLEDLFEAIECAKNLQHQVDALTVKGKKADTAQYRIQTLERTEELSRSDLNSCRIELERIRQKFIRKDDELRVACDNLSTSEAAAEHLQTALPAKDMEFREMQRRARILDGEIRDKDFLVKRNDDLLMDLPVREVLNAELGMLRARVVEFHAMNLAESEQYIAKLKEVAIRHNRIDADRNAWKDTYVSVKRKLKGLSQNEIPCSKLCQIKDAPVELR
ncbi:hypothetical protein GIB67_032023 [Kingdonia uniflora]|uniref:Uncharacterized protein n=1 Tax=Kingdonia uniflora TaxID=39325 RepID=A0A7J7MWU5_9MAGN|nr:hypothetical protein GIB67_032023 [Kingdonia uniflora]